MRRSASLLLLRAEVAENLCIRLRVQRDLRGEEKSIRTYGLRIRTDWLRGVLRYDYVFHAVVLSGQRMTPGYHDDFSACEIHA